MPEYTGYQSVLNAALGEWQSKGYHLVEQGDHALLLFHRDEQVGVFSQCGATPEFIRLACAEHNALLVKQSCGLGRAMQDIRIILSEPWEE
ncbi:MAG: hypothetical protein JRN35_05855 [Nitrososphaerota archaeon]|nr:hypothetical protein [Nitrososphaerota archaeon]